jgi:putative Holliday junction resolvase
MVILALDVGQARIGMAASDPSETLATPRGVIARRSAAQALDAIARAVTEAQAELVVVGLPFNLDGSMGPQAHSVQAFAERLRRRIGRPVEYWDERLSTVAAEEALRAAGVRPERRRGRVDAVAAAIILQEYLDHRAHGDARAGGETPTSGSAEINKPAR